MSNKPKPRQPGEPSTNRPAPEDNPVAPAKSAKPPVKE